MACDTLASTVLLILSGYVIDRLGNRNSALLYMSLTVVGALIVALAPTLHAYSPKSAGAAAFIFMLVGRFIFGLGAESSYGTQFSGAASTPSSTHTQLVRSPSLAHVQWRRAASASSGSARASSWPLRWPSPLCVRILPGQGPHPHTRIDR
jgi:MFS family permease